MIKIETAKSELTQEWTAKVTVGPEEVIQGKAAVKEMVREIVHKVATRYVEENYAEVVKDLDIRAITNLALVDVAGKIATALRWNMNGYPPLENK